ncbi:MAG TPA: hypothetical protein VEY88_19950 [Archangium sp.]|nr:hypothetical protein [Archangium sp.]
MAQSALARAWGIVRKVLGKVLLYGSIAAGVGFSAWVVYETVQEARQPGDFREKFLLSAMDKLILGGVVVLVGYFFQKRLELFKRDQSLASELAKARIAAYNKVISAVTVLEFHVRRLVPKMVEVKEMLRRGREEADVADMDLSAAQERVSITTTEEEEAELRKMLEGASNKIRKAREELATGQQEVDEIWKEFEEKSREFIRLVSTEQHLIGDGFKNAVLILGKELHNAVAIASGDKPPSAADVARLTQERERLRMAVLLSLPPFARVPTDDLQFNEPDLKAVLAEVARKYPAPQKMPTPPKAKDP